MKIVFSEKGQTFQKEVEKGKENQLVGKKIGDVIEGGIIGLTGYKLKITGGSNTEGTPMRAEIASSSKTKALVSGGPGIKHLIKGERRKKSVAGNTVSERTAQINTNIAEKGSQSLADLGFTPKAKEEKKAE
ncbi:30S ribosomal protein S6e [Candidatus Micrarchaeota archaeon]|nr:30S ribosomal protein S6e [Candidatus Micrarchaeota archaeon]